MEEAPLITDTNIDVTIQRMKEYCYYTTDNIEKNLNFCLALLENRPTLKKPNSDAITGLGAVTSPIPYLGKGISTALKEGEIYILNKIDEKNSRTLADLVFHFNDNKEAMRKTLIDGTIDLFYSFENQFLRVTCDGGPRRAMSKLAKDASNRIITHFLEIKQTRPICKDDFTKAAILGTSLKNKIGLEAGKTVENEKGEKWKSYEIFTKVGLCLDETQFFGNKKTDSGKHGYRRAFTWENFEEIRADWTKETPSPPPVYNLKTTESLYSQVSDYIMTKTQEEKLDREKRHEEEMDDRKMKHDEVMETFLERFTRVLDDLARNYEEIRLNREQNETVVTIIKQQEVVHEDRHLQISEKLTEIHTAVLETKKLKGSTENIRNEICVIKKEQKKLLNPTETVVKLSDLVRDNHEVKKVTKVVNEIAKSVQKGDIELKVRKEVTRGIKKIFK